MKKRLLSLLLIAFLILTDIAPVITVAAEELGAVDGEPVIEQMDEPIESLPEGGDSDGLTEEPVPIGWGSASQEVMMASAEDLTIYFKTNLDSNSAYHIKSNTPSASLTLSVNVYVADKVYYEPAEGAPELSCQWYRCNYYGGEAVAIDGATSTSYTISGNVEPGVYHYYVEASADGLDSWESSVAHVFASPAGSGYMGTVGVKIYGYDNYYPTETTNGITISANQETATWTVALDNAAVYINDFSSYCLTFDNDSEEVKNVNIDLTGDSLFYSYGDPMSSTADVITFGGNGSLLLQSPYNTMAVANSDFVLKDSAAVSLQDYMESEGANSENLKSLTIQDNATFTFDTNGGLYIYDGENSSFMVEGDPDAYIDENTKKLMSGEGELLLSGTLTRDTVPRMSFTSYPDDTYSLGRGEGVTLTAAVETGNFIVPNPTVTYTWYEGETVLGTGASYTYSPAAGAHTIHCVASAPNGEDTVSLKGEDISVKVGLLPSLDVTVMNSVDNLKTYGYKWDKENNTLTLSGFLCDGQLRVPSRATIVLAAGSENYIYTKDGSNIKTTHLEPIIMGGGQLTLEQDLVNVWNSPVIYGSGGGDLILSAVDIEVIRHGTHGNGSLIGNSSIVLNGAALNMSWEGNRTTYPYFFLPYYTEFCGSEVTVGEWKADQSSYYYGEYDEASDTTVFKVEPSGLYFEKYIEPNTTYGVELGGSVTLDATVISAEGKAITYTWYASDVGYDPEEHESTVVVGNSKALTINGTERGGKYYYCVATDGENFLTSALICVVTTAKGKEPITAEIDLSSDPASFDKLSTHGYKWDLETRTLTLDNAEIFIPFAGSGRWLTLADGCTITLTANSVNNTNWHTIYAGNLSESTHTATFTGAGVLNSGTINSNRGQLTFTGGITFNTNYMDTHDTSTVTVSNGATLDLTTMGYQYASDLWGTVAVNGGTLKVNNLNNTVGTCSITVGNGLLDVNGDLTSNGSVTVNDGGILRVSDELNCEGSMTVNAGGEAHMANLIMGDPETAAVLTVGGILSITEERSIPLFIYTTKSPAEALVLTNDTKVFYLDEDYAEYIFTLGDSGFGDSSLCFVDTEDSDSYYSGPLLIAPKDTAFTPINSIGAISGTVAYGEMLTAGAITPADATVRYEWEWATDPNGTWTSLNYNGATYKLDGWDVGCYFRVKAIGTGLYTGEVCSEAVGPVKGEDTMLVTIQMGDNDGWDIHLFDSAKEVQSTIYVAKAKEELVPFVAVPTNKDATVTMTLSHEDDSPETAPRIFDSAAAELPLKVGVNTILVTVTYGNQVREYTVTVTMEVGTNTFYLYNGVTGVTIHAKLLYSDGTVEADDIDQYESMSVSDVPYDTEIILTATTPNGQRLWAYGNGALKAEQDGYNTCEYTFSDYTKQISVGSSYLIAEAPTVSAPLWSTNEYGMAVLFVDGMERPTPAVGDTYYDIEIEVIDTATDEAVGDPLSFNGESSQCTISDLDPARSYTFRICYPELLLSQWIEDVDAAGKATQYTTVTLEPLYVTPLCASSEHIVLGVGKKTTLTFDYDSNVQVGVALAWEEMGTEYSDVVSVEGPTVTGIAEGTAYLAFRALSGMSPNPDAPYGYDAQYTYAYIRVDVSENDSAEALHLGETSGSLNLFNDSILTVPVHNMDCNKPILSATFVESVGDVDLNDVFYISVINDRTLLVIPKDKVESGEQYATYAEWGKALSGTYTAKIEVEYDGASPITSAETLTIKLTAKAPSVKATAVKFNSFYVGQTLPLEFTTKDGVVAYVEVDETKATDKAPAKPDWLMLNDDMTVTLENSELDAKGKASGKLNVEVWLEGFRAPAQVAVSVSAAYTAPKLKLSASTLSLPALAANMDTSQFAILSGDKKVSLEALGISEVRVATAVDLAAMSEKDRATYAASLNYKVSDFDADSGLVSLRLNDYVAPVAGKIMLMVYIGEKTANQIVQLPVTVKLVAAPTFKLSKSSITLNTAYGDGAEYLQQLALTCSASGFNFENTEYQILDSKGVVLFDSTEDSEQEKPLNVLFDEYTGTVKVGVDDENTNITTYKVRFTDPAVAKAVDLTVKVVNTAPKLKLSTSSVTINRLMGAQDIRIGIASTDPLYKSLGYDNVTLVDITDASGNPAGAFSRDIGSSDDPNYACQLLLSTYSDLKVGTYTVNLKHNTPNGTEVPATVTIKVVDKQPSLKVDNKSITLIKGMAKSIAIVNISGMEDFPEPSGCKWTINGAEYNGDSNNAVYVSDYGIYADHGLGISLGSNAEVGKTYKVNVSLRYAGIDDEVYSKPIALTVKVVDGITGTVTAKGSMDPIRPDTTATDFTFKYSGFAPRAYTPGEDNLAPTLEWYVVAMNGKVPVTEGMGALAPQLNEPAGVVARGSVSDDFDDSTSEGWFTNVAEEPYGMKLMLNTEDGGAWSEGQVNPKYTYNVHFTLVVPAAATGDADMEYPLGKPVKITLKQGSSKFAADVKQVNLSKMDPYGRAMIELTSTDKDAANLTNIAKVTADGTTFDVKKVGSKYAICWKDNTVPATAKSGSVKLSIWLEGNSFENKPNATVSVKVNVK